MRISNFESLQSAFRSFFQPLAVLCMAGFPHLNATVGTNLEAGMSTLAASACKRKHKFEWLYQTTCSMYMYTYVHKKNTSRLMLQLGYKL